MIDPDPFAQFKETFVTECDELTTDIEQHLADIDAGQEGDEALNAIFRAVHSIKAGACAFQYDELINFSHVFEAFLDKLRTGIIPIDPHVTQILYRGSDILSDLIDAAQKQQLLGDGFSADIVSDMETLLNDAGEDLSTFSCGKEDVHDDNSKEINVYSIIFTPFAEVFRHANEPIFLIRELKSLGDLDVEIDISSLPNIHEIEPEDSYFSWSMELRTQHPIEDIEEVFEFVEGDCKLEIVLLADKAPQAGEHDHNEADTTAASISTKMIEPDESIKTPVPSSSDSTLNNTPSQAIQLAAESGSNPKAKKGSIRVDLDRVDKLVNMVGELVITQAMLAQELESLEPSKNVRLLASMEELASHARELQDNVMAVRMQSVKSVFTRMPRLVRDLSNQLGKKVKLVMVGEGTEVDKTVIEEIADPLTHMIRNSLDHGIELPDVRERNNKKPEGTITLNAEHRGGRIVIEISDDGAGINRKRVLAKAREKQLISDEPLSDEEIDNLIFTPGFSTAQEVTNVSGRGVGMDVVRKNILSLGGRITVQSELGKGSKFTLSLPLTLAVLDGMIVSIEGQKYVIPVNSIIESIRPKKSDIMTLFGDSKVVCIRGEYIPLIPTSNIFNLQESNEVNEQSIVVIVEVGSESHVGIMVDELIGQQQVVIKSLETNYQQIDGISAATILGNGQVCLIIDVDGLEELERKRRGGRRLTSNTIQQALQAS